MVRNPYDKRGNPLNSRIKSNSNSNNFTTKDKSMFTDKQKTSKSRNYITKTQYEEKVKNELSSRLEIDRSDAEGITLANEDIVSKMYEKGKTPRQTAKAIDEKSLK
jgi:hypothetical protein